jgi:hypothetical protein
MARSNRVKAAVTFVESLGSSTQAYCDFPGADEAITCELDGRSTVREGDSLMLSLPSEWCYLFDAEGQAFAAMAWMRSAMRLDWPRLRAAAAGLLTILAIGTAAARAESRCACSSGSTATRATTACRRWAMRSPRNRACR